MTSSSVIRAGVIVLAVAAAVVAGWMLLRSLDVTCYVYSCDGDLVLEPSALVTSPDGRLIFTTRDSLAVTMPAEVADSGGEMLVTAQGCGLLRHTVGREHRITLPPPIRVTVELPGEHHLPSDRRLLLTFRAAGVAPEVAEVLDRGPAPAHHWRRENRFLGDDISVEPLSRTARALLPCTGRWRIEWLLADREATTMAIVWAKGEAEVTVEADRQILTLPVAPEELESWSVEQR